MHVAYVHSGPPAVLYYWYGALFVVKEGYDELRLSDSQVDTLLSVKANVERGLAEVLQRIDPCLGLRQFVSPRHFAGELPGPGLGTLAQPSREARCQAADQRSGNRR